MLWALCLQASSRHPPGKASGRRVAEGENPLMVGCQASRVVQAQRATFCPAHLSAASLQPRPPFLNAATAETNLHTHGAPLGRCCIQQAVCCNAFASHQPAWIVCPMANRTAATSRRLLWCCSPLPGLCLSSPLALILRLTMPSNTMQACMTRPGPRTSRCRRSTMAPTTSVRHFCFTALFVLQRDLRHRPGTAVGWCSCQPAHHACSLPVISTPPLPTNPPTLPVISIPPRANASAEAAAIDYEFQVGWMIMNVVGWGGWMRGWGGWLRYEGQHDADRLQDPGGSFLFYKNIKQKFEGVKNRELDLSRRAGGWVDCCGEGGESAFGARVLR